MNSKCLLALVCLAAFGCGKDPGSEQKKEVCGNQIDDDGNGKVDCDDPACAAEAACNVVKECTAQEDCLQKDGKKYPDYIKPYDPMPACDSYACVHPEALVNINFQAKTTAYSGIPGTISSISTRFVKKTGVNGNPVTCATLEEVAGGKVGNPTAIEDSKRFNLTAYDIRQVSQAVPGSTVLATEMHVMTGKDFIVWTELWSQPPNSLTHLPQGMRYGYACVESGPAVAEILTTDTGRTISVDMPPPQGVQ